MAEITGPVEQLTITPQAMYAFAEIVMQSIIEGQSRNITIAAAGMNLGNPPLTTAQKQAIEVVFFSDAAGANEREATDTIGVIGSTRTLAQILSVTYTGETTDNFVFAVNAAGGLDITAAANIYWAPRVTQSDV